MAFHHLGNTGQNVVAWLRPFVVAKAFSVVAVVVATRSWIVKDIIYGSREDRVSVQEADSLELCQLPEAKL